MITLRCSTVSFLSQRGSYIFPDIFESEFIIRTISIMDWIEAIEHRQLNTSFES